MTHSGSNQGVNNIFFFIFYLFFDIFLVNLKNVYKYAKFNQNIWCGSRVMSSFTNRPRPHTNHSPPSPISIQPVEKIFYDGNTTKI